MTSYQWAIIGPGGIAHNFARDLELMQPSQSVSAVLGHTRPTLDKFCAEFNINNCFTDLDTFLGKVEVDAVYIATPHPQHFEQAIACLKKNLPVLCEKPMTLNAAHCSELIATARAQRCFLMEGMWLRFLPSIRKLMQIIGEGHIGKVLSVKASMGYKAPPDEESRYFNPDLGGGSLLDLGIYPVFLSHLLLGKPAAIKAIASLTKKGIDESCAMLLDYDSGAHAILESTLVAPTNPPAEIAGEKGVIRILAPWFEKSAGIEVQLYNEEKKIYSTPWEGHGLHFEIKEVMDCLSAGRLESDLLPHRLSHDLSETMDEIRRQVNLVYEKFE